MTTLEGAPVRYNQWDSLKAPKFVAAGDAHIDYVGLIPVRISTEQARVGARYRDQSALSARPSK